jgi:hypothetical protein
MAPDERDRSFDKALARHLRSAAPDGGAAPMSGATASRSAACADPETLAAYHERSLLPEEMNSWKEHIVGCANCQTILAQLEATDEIPLQAFEKEEAVVKELEPMMAARNLEAFSKAAASSQDRRRIAKTAPPKKSRRVLLMRGARWQWLAPAGALAAGLLVWIALHENRPLSRPSLDHVQIATKQTPPPPPPVSNAAREAAPSPKTAPSKPQSVADEFANGKTRGALDATKSREKGDYLAQVSPSPILADKGRLRKDAESRAAADVSSAREQLDRDAKIVSGARQENAEGQLQAQAASVQSQNNVQSQNQVNSNSPAMGGPAPLGQAVNTKKEMKAARAAAAPAPPPAAKRVAGYAGGATSLAEEVAVSNPRLIAPPGSHVLWRAGRAGSIDFSSDEGASWSRQTSGVLVDLLTGSAPSDQVCWIVGRVGAILLTTDGGAHWKAVSTPLAEDLGGVRASDALHAMIWNVRATKSFQTSDGGLTWTSVPSP